MATGKVELPPWSEVQHHLNEILQSPAFRSSVRSQQFLEYVVNESATGRGDGLKERVIGERVFGRPADYDTGQDSIVRVKANDVRRRLSQFYELHPDTPIRMEMVSGSYGIRVRRVDRPSSEAPPKRTYGRWLVAGGAALAAALVLLTLSGRRTTAFDDFWRPFVSGSKPLLICMPSPEAFRIYGRDKEGLIQALRPRAPGTAPTIVPASVQDVRIVPEPGLLVGFGDARAMAMVQAFASSRKVDTNSRLSAMTSYADLKAGPAVVIGGETNQWSADLAQEHRFILTKVDGRNVIWDKQNNRAVCTKPQPWETPATTDCALVTRIGKTATGSPLMMAAGLDHYGTYALGDFLTSPTLLQPILAAVPGLWKSNNLQILIEVKRLRDGVGAPRLLAVHTW